MRITANEEYGLRVILRIAKIARSITKPLVSLQEIADGEGITADYAAFILSKLRMANLVESIRGKKGGYRLSKKPEQMSLYEIIHGLSDEAFNKEFCESHSGSMRVCVHSGECSIRPVWATVNKVLNKVFTCINLSDLINDECDINKALNIRLRSLVGAI